MPTLLHRALSVSTAIACFAAGIAFAAPETPAGDPHDFDSHHGRWRTSVRLLLKPLSGSNDWAEYQGTSVVQSLAGGRANSVDLDIAGPRGRIQGVALRLFDAKSGRWTINYAGAGSGALDPPLTGGFGGTRHGVFYGNDTLGTRAVLVRFVIDMQAADTIRFEQSFSGDGGATWEANWIAVDQRM